MQPLLGTEDLSLFRSSIHVLQCSMYLQLSSITLLSLGLMLSLSLSLSVSLCLFLWLLHSKIILSFLTHESSVYDISVSVFFRTQSKDEDFHDY